MKIILTAHQFLPEYSAGTEVLTLETARALRAMGHQVSVFTSGPGQHDGGRCVDYVYDGFSVRRFIPMPTGHTGAYDAARHEYEDRSLGVLFKTYLGEIKPDVVHFFHLMRLTTSAVQAAKSLGIPSVFTPTDFWAICPASQLRLPDNSVCPGADPDAVNCVKHVLRTIRPARKLRFLAALPTPLLRRLLRLLDASLLARWRPLVNIRSLRQRLAHIRQELGAVGRILAPSKTMRERLLGHGYPDEKISLLRYGLVGSQDYPAHRPVSSAEGPVIGFIGTLCMHKGAHVLLQAVASLPAELRFSLKIYGSELDDRRYSASLRKLAGKDPRIGFIGPFANDRIGTVLAGIDVLCVPSIWLENIPLVLLSAQAAKVPVVATNLGGMSEVVEDGHNGFVFPAGDHRALAAILEKLLRDPALLHGLTERVSPPKDIRDYARECLAEYDLAIAAKAGQ